MLVFSIVVSFIGVTFLHTCNKVTLLHVKKVTCIKETTIKKIVFTRFSSFKVRLILIIEVFEYLNLEKKDLIQHG